MEMFFGKATLQHFQVVTFLKRHQVNTLAASRGASVLLFMDLLQDVVFQTQEAMSGVSGGFLQGPGSYGTQDSYRLGPQDRLLGPLDSAQGLNLPCPQLAMPQLEDLIKDLPQEIRLEIARHQQEQQPTRPKWRSEQQPRRADLPHSMGPRLGLVNGVKENLAQYGRLQEAMDSHIQHLIWRNGLFTRPTGGYAAGNSKESKVKVAAKTKAGAR